MKKDEIIAFLQQQNQALMAQIETLNQEVSSLRQLLVEKGEQEARQKRIIKGLSKIQANESERQNVSSSAGTTEGKEQEPKLRTYAKTNNGAKRKEHYEVETVEEDV